MGSAKEKMIEMAERCTTPLAHDKAVCDECVGDDLLKLYIRSNAEYSKCSYCKREDINAIAANVNDFMEHICQCFLMEWDNPNNCIGYDGREGGYQAAGYENGYEFGIRVAEEIGVESDELVEDIQQAFGNEDWCERDPYGLRPHKRMIMSWESYAKLAKQCEPSKLEEFLCNSPEDDAEPSVSPSDILNEIKKQLGKIGIIREFNDRIYRVRPCDLSDNYRTAIELGTPQAKNATQPNRMSGVGNPMFYGALEIDTAISETYDPNGSKQCIAIGEWLPVRPLLIVDLASIPPIPSLFDRERNMNRYAIRFFREFSEAISQPVPRGGDDQLEYRPTQNFVRHLKEGINYNERRLDGVIYRSAKNHRGKCCVIFAENHHCVDCGSQEIKSAMLCLKNASKRLMK